MQSHMPQCAFCGRAPLLHFNPALALAVHGLLCSLGSASGGARARGGSESTCYPIPPEAPRRFVVARFVRAGCKGSPEGMLAMGKRTWRHATERGRALR